jgi:thiol-disulfide isomerase/thioredoxin
MTDSETPPQPPDISPATRVARRRALVLAGAVAGLGGVGAAWWSGQRVQVSQAIPGSKEPVDGFWMQQWERPEGGVVRMQSMRGSPLLLNFWATWCPPCVEELPLINAFYDQNKANGWQVLALAVDKASSVQSFLAKMPLHFPVGLAGLSGAELGRSLGNLGGGLPFTVVFGADGAVVQRKMGKISSQDLASWAGLK